MHKQRIAVVFFILFITMMLTACGAKFPTGTFETQNGTYHQWDFTAKGEFTFAMNGNIENAGTFSVKGDELTWEKDRYCDGTGAGKATYSWAFANDILSLKVIGQDPCSVRLAKLTQFIYYMKPE